MIEYKQIIYCLPALLKTLTGHTDSVLSVSFSPDGETIATGSDDNTVKLWEQWNNLDRFLALGCYWTAGYRQTHTDAAVNALCQRPEIQAKLPDLLRTQALETAKTGNYAAAVAFVQNSPDRAALDAQLRTLASAALKEKALARVSFEKLTDLSELYQDENSQTFRDALKQVQPLTENRQREGVWLLKRAKAIDPSFDLAQAQQALEKTLKKSRDPIVQSFIDRGDELAGNNDHDGAIQQYRYALQLDPKRDLNPEAQFQTVAAHSLMQEIQSLAQKGEITQAIAKLNTLQTTYPQAAIDARTFNYLCWYGALNNQAAQVLSLCDRAVTLSKDDPNYRDSRGVARALTGDFAGAITDFQSVVDSPNTPEQYKPQRRQWIEALKAGKNPFTPEVLKGLKGQ